MILWALNIVSKHYSLPIGEDDFKKVHGKFDIVHNQVQLYVYGPNVKWAFHEVLESYCKIKDPNAPSLLNIESCGVHVLHGAYKTGHKKTDWEVEKQ